MNRRWIAMTFLLACSAVAHAQYKYIGPNGEVTYSDVPPPPSAKDIQLKNFRGGTPAANLPYELRQATGNFPVTVYTGEACPSCDQARTYLKTRGVPYAEKTVTTTEDIDVLKRAAKDPKASSLPLITVGTHVLTGFTEGALASLLDDAGYPATSLLPSGYVYAAAEPAAPRTADSAAAGTGPAGSASAPVTSAAPPLPAGNAPPGFKF